MTSQSWPLPVCYNYFMSSPTLYLFVGYPGAGKTTIARLIAEKTGAVHLWADHERMILFGNPSHTQAESDELYRQLNERTGELLAAGHSVIFDTNFNHFADREHLRQIAQKHNANTVLIWLKTPRETAKERAVHDANLRNGYEAVMTSGQFDTIAIKLEPPTDEEQPITIDGTNIDVEAVKKQLGL